MAGYQTNESLLLDYAAGSLSEGPSLVVATHLALCPEARKQVADMESVGGAMLEEIEPVYVGADCLDELMARLDEAGPARSVDSRERAEDPVLPQPLRGYVGGDIDEIRWKRRGAGLSIAELPSPVEGGHAFLMKVDAGKAMPRHTHDGNEMVMVLQGAFEDESGHFGRGDLAVSDHAVEHQPVASPGPDCICLVFTDAPVRLTGPLGRLMNRFIRI